MNHLFDEAKARAVISSLTTAAALGGDQNGVRTLAGTNLNGLTTQEIRYPPSVRLMEQGANGDREEAIFTAHGVICDKLLPPIGPRSYPQTVANIRNMRQHVKITGLGDDAFDNDAQAIQQIHSIFQGHMHNRQVNPIEFAPYEGHACLEAHARYFTDRDLIPYDKQQPFLPGVDPDHVLRSLQPRSLIHGPDNVVEYCRRTVGENGELEYHSEDPRAFREGDVVEVSFSVMGVRIRDHKAMVFFNLRALTMIDDSIRKTSEAAVVSVRSAMNNRTPKRKLLYLTNSAHFSNAGLKKQRSESAIGVTRPLFLLAAGTQDDISTVARAHIDSTEPSGSNTSTCSIVPAPSDEELSSEGSSVTPVDNPTSLEETTSSTDSIPVDTSAEDQFDGIDVAFQEAWATIQAYAGHEGMSESSSDFVSEDTDFVSDDNDLISDDDDLESVFCGDEFGTDVEPMVVDM